MVPPQYGDTTIMDTPEFWLGRPLETIVDYRYSLVRGNTRANVEDAADPGRTLLQLQELSMAARPVDSELQLTKAPRKTLTLSEDTQPFGPVGPDWRVSRPRTSRWRARSRSPTTTGT